MIQQTEVADFVVVVAASAEVNMRSLRQIGSDIMFTEFIVCGRCHTSHYFAHKSLETPHTLNT